MFRDYVCDPSRPDLVYVVQKGDSLSRIASRELGNLNRWPEIADINLLKSPYILFVGQRLYLPEIHLASTLGLVPLGNYSEPASLPRDVIAPAKEVEHPPVKLKLDKDIKVLQVVFPGGEIEIGFKGEITMHRLSSLPISVTRDGLKVDLESSHKDWAASKFMSVFNGIGLSVNTDGSLKIVGKTGLETEWYKGTFEIAPDGSLKYEVEPKPINAKFKDFTVSGNIGCWIKAKPDLKLDPSVNLQYSLRLSEAQIRDLLTVFLAFAATGVAALTFAEFLQMVATGAVGAASSFMLILIPPGVIQELNRQTTGQISPNDYST